MASIEPLCIICNIDTEEKLQRVKKGFEAMKCSSLRKDKHSLHNELVNKWESKIPINVHDSCRKVFTDKRPSQSSTKEASSVSKRLRSQSDDVLFNWKTNCFLCSKVVDKKRTPKKGIRYVKTVPVNCKRILFDSSETAR